MKKTTVVQLKNTPTYLVQSAENEETRYAIGNEANVITEGNFGWHTIEILDSQGKVLRNVPAEEAKLVLQDRVRILKEESEKYLKAANQIETDIERL